MAAAVPLVEPQSAITSIVFHYGTYCPPGALCVLALPTRGYVIFDMAYPIPDVRVAVSADDQGVVTATGPVQMSAAS